MSLPELIETFTVGALPPNYALMIYHSS